MRHPIHHETDEAKRHNPKLSHSEAELVAIAALAALALQGMANAMYLAKAATLTAADLKTFHPLVPWVTLAANLLLMLAAYAKGIRYWLVYVLAGFTVLSSLLWIALFAGIIDSGDLWVWNRGPDWWRGIW